MRHHGTMTDAQEQHRRMNKRSIKAQVPAMIHCGDRDVSIVTETANHVHVMCGECQQIWSVPA
jgi:hypothetical protein